MVKSLFCTIGLVLSSAQAMATLESSTMATLELRDPNLIPQTCAGKNAAGTELEKPTALKARVTFDEGQVHKSEAANVGAKTQ